MTADGARAFFAQLGDAAALGPLFDHVPGVYLFVKDSRHRFVMVNLALAHLHGCDAPAGMLGKSDYDFHPPLLAQQYIDEDRRVMASGRPVVDESWLVPGADGLPRWYLSTKMPLRDRRGRVIGLAGVMRPLSGGGPAAGAYQRLTAALDHAMRRFGDPLTIGDLAQKAHLSVSQFQREFRRLFRISPREYLFRVRLQVARHRLESTEDPLARIATDCGFCDQSHFVKRFKAATGMRPLEYRRRFKP